MIYKHIKRHSTSYAIRGLQIKTRNHYLFDWEKSKTLTTPNAYKDAKQQKLSFVAGEDAKCYCYF